MTTLKDSDYPLEQSARGLASRAVGGAMWTSAGEVLRFILHWVVFVVMARLLSPEDFGVYSLALVVVGLGQLFGELGLGPSLIQRTQLNEFHIRVAFTTTLILSFVAAGLVALLAPYAANFMGSPDLGPAVRVLSVVFLIRGVGLVAGSLLQRDLRFPELARIEVISYFIGYGMVGTGMGLAGFGYWALIWAAISQSVIQTMLYLFGRSHEKRLLLSLAPLRELLSFGVGASLGRLGNYLALKGDYLVVGKLLGVAPLGIYSRAYGLMSVPVGLYANIAQKALFSTIARVQDDGTRLAIAHRRVAAVTALILVPGGVALSILAPEVVAVVLGSKWTQVVAPFQIMALGLFLRSGYNVGAAVSKGTGQVHQLALRQWLYMLLVVGAAWLGHFRGVMGVAAAVVGAIGIHFFMITRLSLRCSGLTKREWLLAHIPAVKLSIIVGITLWIPAYILRILNIPSAIVLISAMVLAGAAVVVLTCLAPIATLGQDGVWIIRTIKDLLPSWIFQSRMTAYLLRLAPTMNRSTGK